MNLPKLRVSLIKDLKKQIINVLFRPATYKTLLLNSLQMVI